MRKSLQPVSLDKNTIKLNATLQYNNNMRMLLFSVSYLVFIHYDTKLELFQIVGVDQAFIVITV